MKVHTPSPSTILHSSIHQSSRFNSKEILLPKDRSFIVSSINDEIYKNLIQADNNIASAGINLSMSSLKSAKNDKTFNQYDDIIDNESSDEKPKSSKVENIKYKMGNKVKKTAKTETPPETA